MPNLEVGSKYYNTVVPNMHVFYKLERDLLIVNVGKIQSLLNPISEIT